MGLIPQEANRLKERLWALLNLEPSSYHIHTENSTHRGIRDRTAWTEPVTRDHLWQLILVGDAEWQ